MTESVNSEILLGSGTYGSVYKFQVGDSGSIAKKILQLSDEQLSRTCLLELNALGHLKSYRGIVSIYHTAVLGLLTGTPQLVIYMECLTCNLRQLIDRMISDTKNYINIPLGDYSVYERLYNDIAAGLSACHSHDIVHLDVKPENILCDLTNIASLEFRLCDFGLARPIAVLESIQRFSGEYCYTPGYRSPEVLISKCPQDYDIRQSDNWSFGITLTEYLNRCRMNTTFNTCEKIYQHRSMPTPKSVRMFNQRVLSGTVRGFLNVPLPKDLPDDKRKQLRKLLSFNPYERSLFRLTYNPDCPDIAVRTISDEYFQLIRDALDNHLICEQIMCLDILGRYGFCPGVVPSDEVVETFNEAMNISLSFWGIAEEDDIAWDDLYLSHDIIAKLQYRIFNQHIVSIITHIERLDNPIRPKDVPSLVFSLPLRLWSAHFVEK